MAVMWKLFSLNGRSFRRAAGAALLLAGALCVAPVPARANGNTSADAPAPAEPAPKEAEAPVRKAVRKAPLKRAKPKAVRKPARKTAALRPAVSALEQGIALMEQDRCSAALPWLRRALQENRRSAAAWYWYGLCHERTGQFYEAQYFYTKALECDPAFEPLARVVVYPGDGSKTPLWDPRRPARVYSIPTNAQGMATIPPDAPQARKLPTRPPLDPQLPRVPLYVPPEPGAQPADGDAWQPSLYVPPTRGSALEAGDEQPAYLPPPADALPGTVEEPAAVVPLPDVQPVYQPGVGVTQVPFGVAPQVQGGGAPVYQPPQPQTEPEQPKPAPRKPRPKKKPAPKKQASVKAEVKSEASPLKAAGAPKEEPSVRKAPELPAPEPVTVLPRAASPDRAAVTDPSAPASPESLPPVGQRAEGAQPLPPVGQKALDEDSEIQ